MKRSALKRIAVSVRRVLDSVFGSSAPQLCFEAFFRSTARLYLTENGFISSDEPQGLSELMPQIFPETDFGERVCFCLVLSAIFMYILTYFGIIIRVERR